MAALRPVLRDSQDGWKSKSRGLTAQGQVSAPCTPTEPALANQVQQTSLNFFGTQLQLLSQRHGNRGHVLAHRTPGSCGCSCLGRESEGQRRNLRKMACSCEDRTHQCPRASAVSPRTGGATLWGWRLPLSLGPHSYAGTVIVTRPQRVAGSRDWGT